MTQRRQGIHEKLQQTTSLSSKAALYEFLKAL